MTDATIQGKKYKDKQKKLFKENGDRDSDGNEGRNGNKSIEGFNNYNKKFQKNIMKLREWFTDETNAMQENMENIDGVGNSAAELAKMQTQLQTLIEQYNTAQLNLINNTKSYINSNKQLDKQKNVFVSNVVNNPSSTYLNTYNIPSKMAGMTALEGGAVYNFNSCVQGAINKGFSFFGLQDYNPVTKLATCKVFDDVVSIQKMEPAGSNCKLESDNYRYGEINSNALYKVPDAVYINTYNDQPVRAMNLVNDGSQTFSYESCKKEAIQNGAKYFGLQNGTSGTAQCSLSSDWTLTSQYGTSTNFTVDDNDKKEYGGAWANAVYEVTNIAENLGCYKSASTGASPSMILAPNGATYDFTSCQAYAVSNGYKFFGLQGGPPGSATCSVSNDFQQATQYGLSMPFTINPADKHAYGNQPNTSVYSIGYPNGTSGSTLVSDLNKVGYFDASSSVLYEYPSSMIGKGTMYSKETGYNNVGNNITDGDGFIQGLTATQCQEKCDNHSNCRGFVFENPTGNCYLKDSNFNKTNQYPNPDTDVYYNIPSIVNGPCGQNVESIDSIDWSKMNKSPTSMSPELGNLCGLAKSNALPQETLDKIKGEITVLLGKIINNIHYLKNQDDGVIIKIGLNKKQMNDYLSQYEKLNNTLVNEAGAGSGSGSINGIVLESSLTANYEKTGYDFWLFILVILLVVFLFLLLKK
jgi:hypothetical protein